MIIAIDYGNDVYGRLILLAYLILILVGVGHLTKYGFTVDNIIS